MQNYQEQTFTFPKMVARVFIPILEPGEREKRMKAIHKASAELVKEVKK
jgi:hypothetical protein